MPEHLRLPSPLTSPTRRAGRGGGRPPVRDSPFEHALNLGLALVEPPEKPAALTGVDPDLVFKFQSSGPLTASSLRSQDLDVLAENDEWTYFVLVDDVARTQFIETLERYGAAVDQQAFVGSRSLYDSITTIDGIEPYVPEDRLDPRLTEESQYPLDIVVRIWPSNDRLAAQRRVATVRSILEGDPESRLLAQDFDPEATTVIASVSEATLGLLSMTSVIEQISPPFQATISAEQVAQFRSPNPPQPAGAPIGVLDDGFIRSNSLASSVVIDGGSFPPSKAHWAAPSGHGMAVASLAAYFDFEKPLRENAPLPIPHPVVLARVVEPDPDHQDNVRQPRDVVFEESIDEAIRNLASRGVRVISMSLNESDAPRPGTLPTMLAFTLDRLVSELNIVIIVSAGNIAPQHIYGDHILGLHAAKDYPDYLKDARAVIASPGGAANVVTVSSVAHYDAPSLSGYARIAPVGCPSPFTRTGAAITKPRPAKPDLSHWGGNWAWNNHLDTVHRGDPALTSIVASKWGNPELEPGHNGTSFAAPRVAHIAAEILDVYPDASANLVRALLALSAVTPSDLPDARPFVGWGRPTIRAATESGANRAVMITDGELNCDTSVIYRIPIPTEYATGRSRRHIRIALAYDPPVRRQRREYTAGLMTVALVRSVDAEQALEIFQRQPTKQQVRADPSLVAVALPSDRRRLKLEPSSNDIGRETLIRTAWTGELLNADDGDEYFLAVSHLKAGWTALGDYTSQRYGLAVELVDEGRPYLNLHDLVAAQLGQRVNVRQRATIGPPQHTPRP